MNIKCFQCGPINTNCYALILDDKNMIAFDVAEGAFQIFSNFAKKNNLNIQALFLTHPHWDHVWDAKLFQNAGIKVYAHSNASPILQNADIQNSFLQFENKMKSITPDVELSDSQIIKFENLEIEVRLAEGHCVGSAVYYIKNFQIAFVGDVIFSGSIGRYDLPTGNFAKLEKSIKTKIYTLPDDTIIYPGHGQPTTVKNEKFSNPYVTA